MQYVYGGPPTIWRPLVLNTHTRTHAHTHTHTHTQIDNDLRKTWDNFALKLETVDSDPRTGSDVIHWVMKYPVSVFDHHRSRITYIFLPPTPSPLHLIYPFTLISLLLLPYSLTRSILHHLFHTLPHSSTPSHTPPTHLPSLMYFPSSSPPPSSPCPVESTYF